MIRHVVLLNWKEGTSRQAIDAVSAELASLASEISEIRSYTFGPDAGVYRGNASYALVADFDSIEDLKGYVMHPKHQEFLSRVSGPILESFQCAQFIC